MKKFEIPLVKVHDINNVNIISTSNYSDKPGHGWGDKNHEHSGPPGRHKVEFVW